VVVIAMSRTTYVAPSPTYSVTLKDGEQWIVEAEWLDGTIEQIAAFKSYFDARHWLNDHCKASAHRPIR
jgi:hypothetical protein